jgi:hypothetical protein
MGDDFDRALEDTTQSWKRQLLVAARDSGKRERWILRIAASTLAVAVVSLIVVLIR